jgi:hypothetical protein
MPASWLQNLLTTLSANMRPPDYDLQKLRGRPCQRSCLFKDDCRRQLGALAEKRSAVTA